MSNFDGNFLRKFVLSKCVTEILTERIRFWREYCEHISRYVIFVVVKMVSTLDLCIFLNMTSQTNFYLLQKIVLENKAMRAVVDPFSQSMNVRCYWWKSCSSVGTYQLLQRAKHPKIQRAGNVQLTERIPLWLYSQLYGAINLILHKMSGDSK